MLGVADAFLASDPVRHNVILTLLHGRVAHPEPGRYWVVDVDGRTGGVVFQSPLHYPATITPMSPEALSAVVDAIVGGDVRLPGATGEAASAARFAGHWTERAGVGARPVQGQRIYEVEYVTDPRPARGGLRRAGPDDQDLLVAWFQAFQADIGETVSDTSEVVERRIAAGQLWIWSDREPVATAGLSAEVSGVVRVGPVYTPPERRNHGYASSLVAAISRAVLSDGLRCILYTDLENPTSNAIYRSIGYQAVAEALRYEFDAS
ncbi:MAG: GNAT family N-acetyltransferase [Acidimicrobiia bacterium]